MFTVFVVVIVFHLVELCKRKIKFVELVRNDTHSSAKPVLNALSPVAVVQCNAFPLDHQLVL